MSCRKCPRQPISDNSSIFSPRARRRTSSKAGHALWLGEHADSPDAGVDSRALQPELSDAVRLAVVDGDADAWATIEKGTAPLIAAPDTSGADLVWDVGKHEALASGDLVMQLVDRSMIGFVADRTWAIRRLRALSPHVLSIGLASHGKLLIPGDEAKVQFRLTRPGRRPRICAANI